MPNSATNKPSRSTSGRRMGCAAIGMAMLASVFATGCGSRHAPLATAPSVDVERYAGRWFEIAHLPNSFQKGCVGTTADYFLRSDGKITVVNQCWKGSFDAKRIMAKGTARVVDKATNAKLKVSFFWPFEGNYWIVKLDPNYQWAMIGEPSRKYFWILAREPRMDPALFSSLKADAEAMGFELTELSVTEHSDVAAY